MRVEKTHTNDRPAGGFASSLMGEIAHMLEALAVAGENGAIDLRSMPMSNSDRKALEGLLGRGEVHAALSIAGTSEIRETGYSGVWWITHRGADEQIASETIEVTLMPEILKTRIEDIPGSLKRLREDIESRHVSSRQEKNE